MTSVMILGAGIAGLASAFYLGKNHATIFEKGTTYGGLCGNFSINGFRFDHAVHLSFTTSSIVREIFDKVPYLTHKPLPVNYYNGMWVKHPVQNNLFPLPIDERIEAIKGFIDRPEANGHPDNYREWLYQQYGGYIAEHFPIPYTRKYWRENAEDLGVNWISNRMYRPNLDEILKGALTDSTADVYYAKEMRYPSKGGYKSFVQPLADQANIKYGKEAVIIDASNKYVEFSDGTKEYYDHLISSLPLTELGLLVKDLPMWLKESLDKLNATSVMLVSMGFSNPDVAKHLWFYIYNEDMHVSRVYSPNLKSPDNVPRNCSSLQFEIYVNKKKESIQPDAYYIENAIYSLEKMKIASPGDLLFIDTRLLKYGNVIFYKDTEQIAEQAREYFEGLGIYTIGRFGEWKYYWSDQSFLSGYSAAAQLKNKL